MALTKWLNRKGRILITVQIIDLKLNKEHVCQNCQCYCDRTLPTFPPFDPV